MEDKTNKRMINAIREIYEVGAPMTPGIASKVLKMFKKNSSSDSNEEFGLTEREKEILRLLVEGMSYKMIATTSFISIDTVSGHIKNIYKKLQVHSKILGCRQSNKRKNSLNYIQSVLYFAKPPLETQPQTNKDKKSKSIVNRRLLCILNLPK